MFLLLGGAYLWGAVGDLRVNASWTISLLMVGLGVCGVIAGATHRR
jgi:hypothetical protein